MTAPAIPKNLSAEQATVACLLSGASVFAAPLTSAHFSAADCQLVFEAVRDLAEARQPVTLQTVRAALEARGQLSHAGGDPSRFYDYGGGGDAVLAYHFAQLEDARRNREAVLFVNKHLGNLCALRMDATAFAEQLAEACAPLAVAGSADDAATILAAKEARLAAGETKELFAFGLPPLDRHLAGGLMRGEMAVIAGNTGGGKSALLIQAAATNADAGRKVRYFSLELGQEEIFDRMACALRGVSAKDSKFRRALCDLGALPVKIHDRLTDLAEIGAEIRAAVRAGDCDVAIIDYIQRTGSRADSRELEVSCVSRTLKTIARREGIVVLTASQLNDNGQLRESRAIGHDADFVFTICENGLLVDKCRRGPRGVMLPCHLLGAQSRFVHTAREAEATYADY